ncbi:DUF1684 domain-containing protein [Anaerolineales bacterium]
MMDLLDWRRRTHELYQIIRSIGPDKQEAFQIFQQSRNELFATHPQSPLDPEQKADFKGLSYFPYNPIFHTLAPLHYLDNPVHYDIDLGADGLTTLIAFATIPINIVLGNGELTLYWIKGYGGGLFLPFKDQTNGQTTYGGGRYLFDTIKGADLGSNTSHILIDFNYAYNPSCHYNPRWICPLSPRENTLNFMIQSGEKKYSLIQ